MTLLSWILTPVESGLIYTGFLAFAGGSFVGLRVARGDRRSRPLRTMLAVGVAALGGLLVAVAIRGGYVPLQQRYEALVVSAFGLGAGALWIGRRGGMPMLAAVAAPTLALLTLFALLLVPEADGTGSGVVAGRIAHIALASLGFAGFSVSAGVGLLYLRQIRLLKRSPSAALGRGAMPSLEKLDRLNVVSAAFGFPCLALSLLAGKLFLGRLAPPGVTWWLDPTVLVAVAGLLVYTVLFLARGFLGWHGRRIAWLSVAGFVIAVGGFVVAAACTSERVLHP